MGQTQSPLYTHLLPFNITDFLEGVVITFTDITSFKQLEQDLTDARNFAEEIVSTVRESLIVLDPAMKVISANRSFYKTFHTSKEEVEGRIFYTLGDGQWDIPAFRKSIESVLPEKSSFENFKVSRVFPGIGHRMLLLNARKILSGRTDKESILLAIEDLTPKGDAGQ
ncbi:MAG: PAS domain-containing protein [Methanoregula sp.]